MKSNLLSDFKDTVKAFCEIRKMRQEGVDEIRVSVRPVYKIPFISLAVGFFDTIEGCTLSHCSGEIEDAAREAFRNLPTEEKHRLSHDIADGEFIERANYWRELLKPVLSPKQLNIAMMRIIHWYTNIGSRNLEPADKIHRSCEP